MSPRSIGPRQGQIGVASKNPNSFDLNLVKVFLAIWELRSLTAAGQRLGLTQPAVSHGLRRLREHFSDPLFTRFGHTMVPTEAAARLFRSFDEAMQIMSQSIREHDAFAPDNAIRSFRIAMSDVSEFALLPRILPFLKEEAPGVRLESVELDAQSVEGDLRSGTIDAALGFLPHLGPECRSTPLFEDRFVCLLRQSHAFGGERLEAGDFSALGYIDVAAQAIGYRTVDQRLHQLGVQRDVKIQLRHFAVVPEIVRQTDLAALFPRFAAECANRLGGFRLLELAFDLPTIPIGFHIHRNFVANPGLDWLQGVVRRALTAIPNEFE